MTTAPVEAADATGPVTPSPAMPWPAFAASLTAFTALYVVGGQFFAMPVLALLLAGPYLTSWRLPANPLIAWLIRVVLFGTLIAIAPERNPSGISILLEPDYVHFFGYLCAAELAIRAWVRRAGGPSKGEVLLLSALVLTAATNTHDPRWIRLFAPVYVVFAAITLRSFRARRAGPMNWRALPVHVVALLLATSIGLTATLSVAKFERELTRLSMRLLMLKRDRPGGIGVGRDATLGPVFNPQASPRRMLVVRGLPGEHHLRAIAFESYSQGNWGPPVDRRPFAPFSPPTVTASSPQTVTITRLADGLNLLYTPLNAAAIAIDVPVEQDRYGTIRTPPEAGNPLDYTLTVGGPGDQGIVALPPTPEELEQYRRIPPELDPGVRTLAAAVVAAGSDPKLRIAAIAHHLQTNHRYSLSFDPGTDADPLSVFLLQKRDAHCMYFASAVVVMARCAGIPARYVSGYYAHESTGDGVTVVRQRDAHAWAECWIDGTGWVTVDATPATGRPDELFPAVPWWRRASERISDVVSAVKAWLADRTLAEGAVMVAILAAIPVVIRVWKKRHDRGRRAAARGYGPAAPELAGLAQRFDRLLRRRAVPCPPERTWQEHATVAAPPAADFVRLYNTVRFGGDTATGDHLSRLAALLDDLEQNWHPEQR